MSDAARRSPALIVAALALVFALVGTSVAQDPVAKLTKSKVKKIARKQIDKAAPGLSVNHANTAETAKPTGPAGGDLAGTYPDPLIGTGKVLGTNLADAAVGNAKIAADAVTTDKIANGQVRAPDLGQVIIRTASDTVVTGDSGLVAVTCPGNEIRLGGGGFFDAPLNANKGLQASFGAGSQTWAVVGRNNSGTTQTLNVQALCLQG